MSYTDKERAFLIELTALSRKHNIVIGGATMSYIRYADFDADYKFAEKAGFQLTDMQIKDVETFVGWSASLNSYEVGGGKSVVSTVTALMRGRPLKIVTVPPILITPWCRWLEKVSTGVCCYRGTPSQRAELLKGQYQWLVLSHTILRMDFDKISKLSDFELIVDEAAALKNPSSWLFRVVQALSLKGNVQLLTGTPISKPLDAYAYIKICTPDVYRSYGQFELIHVTERNFFKAPTAYGELGLLKSNFSLRNVSRTKEELHGYNLAPIFPDTQYELSSEHYRLYEKLVDEQLLLFDDGSKIEATTAQRMMHALQQVVVNFDYFSNDATKRSATFDIVDECLEESECANVTKTKVIFWIKYRRTAAKLLDYINSKGIKAVAAYGGADSEKSVAAFMDDPQTRVLIGQYQSCGQGLNAQFVCSYACFLEGETTSMLMRQAIGRLVRPGQTKKPIMKLAIAQKTVQERLFAGLMKNEALVELVDSSKKGIRQMLLGG